MPKGALRALLSRPALSFCFCGCCPWETSSSSSCSYQHAIACEYYHCQNAVIQIIFTFVCAVQALVTVKCSSVSRHDDTTQCEISCTRHTSSDSSRIICRMRLVILPIASSACEHKWVKSALCLVAMRLLSVFEQKLLFQELYCSSSFIVQADLLAWLLAVYCQLI